MVGAADTTALLAAVPLFSGLDAKGRKSLATQGKILSYKVGDNIVEEGAMGVGFFLILDGKAEVRKGGKVLANLSKGEFFGEMSLIDSEPRSADVVAVSSTSCWALSSWAFDSVVKTHPDIAVVMLREIVKRLRAAQSSAAS